MDDPPSYHPTGQAYVAGFYFNPNGDVVLLVEKKRPKWQAGKLNAIGGHIERGEQPIDAMVREFEEETGCPTSPEDWRAFATIRGAGFVVFFFMTRGQIPLFRNTTDEDIGIYGVDKLARGVYETIPNLRWLIPLALDKDKVVALVQDPNSQE